MIPTRLVNDEYGWETNRKFESAIEIGLKDDRIILSTSFYQNRSSSQLVGYALPVITGQSSIQRNLPATVQNTGWEFELNTVNLKENLSWTTNLNLTIPRNKLIEYPDLQNSPYANDYVIGKPLNIIKKYRYTGVDPVTGYYTFQDVNEDGVLTTDDYQFRGKLGTDLSLGMANTIKFKGLQLDFLIQAVKQTGRSYIESFGFPGSLSYNANQPSLVMNRWEAPGDDTDIQKFGSAGNSAYLNLGISDRYIADASFIRLKNAQISYQLPMQWLDKAKMKNARVYVQGQNLLTVTNNLGLDPETQSSKRLPPLRIITMGVQILF